MGERQTLLLLRLLRRLPWPALGMGPFSSNWGRGTAAALCIAMSGGLFLMTAFVPTPVGAWVMVGIYGGLLAWLGVGTLLDIWAERQC